MPSFDVVIHCRYQSFLVKKMYDLGKRKQTMTNKSMISCILKHTQ